IENDWIYYSDADGIWRMHLDTTDREVIISEYGELLTCFEGKLYYRGEDPTKLYQYTPGQTPVLLDDTTQIATLKIIDGELNYGVEGSEKQIDLNEFQLEMDSSMDIKHLPPVTLPKHKTFQIKVTFAQTMDKNHLPKQFIGLKTEDGRTIPVHMMWDQEGTSLTVRAATYINDEAKVTAYLLPGITSRNGQKTTEFNDLGIMMKEK
ncbi:MAG: hypothetical protein K0S47_4190, partial [Herbinix sp.]|nr:hypothetical protein [Herbinix sp.]